MSRREPKTVLSATLDVWIDIAQPEDRAAETMWRAMRMAKQFTPAELCGLIDQPAVTLAMVRRYCRSLEDAGVLLAARKRDRLVGYQLRRSLGPAAPKTLQVTCLYDPNRNAMLASLSVHEVSP